MNIYREHMKISEHVINPHLINIKKTLQFQLLINLKKKNEISHPNEKNFKKSLKLQP